MLVSVHRALKTQNRFLTDRLRSRLATVLAYGMQRLAYRHHRRCAFASFASRCLTTSIGQSTALKGSPGTPLEQPAPPAPSNIPSRTQMIASLEDGQEYDVLIVGGGATGAGCALDAASRGLKVACLERGDFGSETSSRSTKLIWAGSRYLFNVVAALTSSKILTAPRQTLSKCWDEYKMVVGCARERRYMAEKNPHLVNWVPIALPFDRWVIWPPPMGAWAFAFMPIACRLNAIKWFYDSLAGFSCPAAFVMSKQQTVAKFPQLTQRDIKFCAVLHEAQHNDARTNLAIALSAAEHGADITNYTPVTGLTKNEAGRVTGATAVDTLTGRSLSVTAKSVIIAGGPYTDSIRQLEADEEIKPAVQGGPGIHIVLPGYFSPNDMGLLDYNTTDGRFLFLLPWQGSTIVGTTDRKSAAQTAHNPPEDEIQWVLNECGKYLDDSLNVKRTDVLSAWRGWRPLAKDPHAAADAPVSRDHIISENPETGVFFIAGREMAEDMVDRVVKRTQLQAAPCSTLEFGLHGVDGYHRNLHAQLVQQYGVSEDVAYHLAHTYGGRAHEVCQMAAASGKRWPTHGVLLADGYPYIESEVRYAAREWAVSVKDVVTLRTRLGYLNKIAAEQAVPRVTELMGMELGWSAEKQASESKEALQFLATFGGPEGDKSSAMLRAATQGDVAAIFAAIDDDHSGYLDRSEVAAAAVKLGFPLDETALNNAFVSMDQNGDNQVSLDEFSRWWNDDAENPLREALNKEMALSLEKAQNNGGGVLMG